MATFHNSRDDLKSRYEELKRARLFPGRIFRIIWLLVCSAALLYAIVNPLGLKELIRDAYWSLVPESGFLSFLIQLIMVLGQNIVLVIWILTYPFLICSICCTVYALRKQNYGHKTEEEAKLEGSVLGEEAVLSVLAPLPDKLHVYTKVRIPWRD